MKKKLSNDSGIFTYEITPLTMAIISKESENGAIHSHVIEEDFEYTVLTTPTKTIDFACKYYGASLKGRLDGTKDVSNITYKAPIAIDPVSGMYFFPTASPTNKACSWVAHTHIETIYPIEKGIQTGITFKNGKQIILNVSFGSMVNQQQRTAQYRFSLDKRMKIIENALMAQEMVAEK
jgi:competence protein ComK